MQSHTHLTSALARYTHALARLQTDPDELLAVLLARDDVAAALADGAPLSVVQARQIAALDEELRQCDYPPDLAAWRASFAPPDTAWWWYLDAEARAQADAQEEQERRSDLPWMILASVLVTLTIPLALDIIRRLWDGAPDTVSLAGTLLTLLLTGGPLTERGQELATWVLRRLRLRPTLHAEVLAGAAALAFGMVLLARIAVIPLLAVAYNNQGITALEAGNITAARQAFQRSTALNPDAVVPYLNLGDAYATIGLHAEAISWYQQALERDANIRSAYAQLGQQYNQQGEYATAEQLLLAGLDLPLVAVDAALVVVTEYNLLANLGWTYFAQEEYMQARAVLEAAVALEPRLVDLETAARTVGQPVQYRQALPHYYLAQVYEALDAPQRASCAWEETLRYLDRERWQDREWHQHATQRIQELGRCTP